MRAGNEPLSDMTLMQAGAGLPAWTCRFSLSDVVAMSIATRDFHPVHHDVECAKSLGHPGVFINIMTTAALLETYLRRCWTTQGRLSGLQLRLGVPHYVGDELTWSARLQSCEGSFEEGTAVLEFEAHNQRGRHASGVARFQFSR